MNTQQTASVERGVASCNSQEMIQRVSGVWTTCSLVRRVSQSHGSGQTQSTLKCVTMAHP